MNDAGGVLILIVLGLIVAIGAGFGCPSYNVYLAEMSGKAALAKAEQDREIVVREARANSEAAELDAKSRVTRAEAEARAEVERARGVAEANRIIAEGLGGADGYLRYLYIDALRSCEAGDVIYIPTEAGVPILEAGVRGRSIP